MGDQFYNAHRLAVMGLAPPGIPVNRLTAKRLQDALQTSLALPAAPRQAMAARMRNGNGLPRAVAFIEQTVQSQR
jgi:UDP:flavonoid glycosyltransferase YjiC (YdhE family)